MLNYTQKQCNKTAKYASDFVMLPTCTYPEIVTAKCLLSNADFIFHHPPLTTWSNNGIKSGKLCGNKNLSEPWKKVLNGNLPPALQIFVFALASWVLKLDFCAQNMAGWGRQSQITPWGRGNRTHSLQSSKEVWGPGLQRLLSHWPLVMSRPCLQGPGNAPWLMESLIFGEYTFHPGGAATGSFKATKEGPVRGCQSTKHRGPSVVLK